MKLRIIGGSGSGKTYLARRLAQEYDIPHVELDELQWDSGATLLGVCGSSWICSHPAWPVPAPSRRLR